VAGERGRSCGQWLAFMDQPVRASTFVKCFHLLMDQETSGNMFILYFLIQKVLLVLKKYYIENLIVEYLQAHIITHFFGILLA